ncbi:MAG: hypothetical protein GIW95_01535 [Candidatus Eremiobacteraeota bacterium]|nr:hypothetical protein [Candidatus Eremiobacteraeota bacterium]
MMNVGASSAGLARQAQRSLAVFDSLARDAAARGAAAGAPKSSNAAAYLGSDEGRAALERALGHGWDVLRAALATHGARPEQLSLPLER